MLLLTLIFFPGKSSISCRAMSLHSAAFGGILLSHSQFLFGVWAYKALGVACVTLVVVTNPSNT